MRGKRILRSNFLIMYRELENAIKKYLDYGHLHGDTDKIDAYLAATLHALIDFTDRFWGDDEEIIKAFKYANNALKHDCSLVSHKKITGGFSFPIHSPLEISEITVVWNYDHSVKVNSQMQQEAFKKLLAGQEILTTLEPLVMRISDEV